MKFTWTTLREVIIIVVGVAMILLMQGIREQQNTASKERRDIKAVDCALYYYEHPQHSIPACKE